MKAMGLMFETKSMLKMIKGKVENGRFRQNKNLSYLVDKTDPAILKRPSFFFMLTWLLGASLRPIYIFDHSKAVSLNLDRQKQEFKFATPQQLKDIDNQKSLQTLMTLTGNTSFRDIIMWVMMFGMGAFAMYFAINSGFFG